MTINPNVNWQMVDEVRQKNPSWSSVQIAAALECDPEYVRATFRRRGWPAANKSALLEASLARIAELEQERALIDALRAEEGATLTFVCDNPDFNGQPNCLIICAGSWTDWKDRHFPADTIIDALRLAKDAMDAAAKAEK